MNNLRKTVRREVRKVMDDDFSKYVLEKDKILQKIKNLSKNKEKLKLTYSDEDKIYQAKKMYDMAIDDIEVNLRQIEKNKREISNYTKHKKELLTDDPVIYKRNLKAFKENLKNHQSSVKSNEKKAAKYKKEILNILSKYK